jgi:hypothetical protein
MIQSINHDFFLTETIALVYVSFWKGAAGLEGAIISQRRQF